MKLRQAKKVVGMLRAIGWQLYSVHRHSTAQRAWRRIARYRHLGVERAQFNGGTIWFDETTHFTAEDWERAGLTMQTPDQFVVPRG